MRTIVIIAEKPSCTAQLGQFLPKAWRESNLIAHYVNAVGGPYKFAYPRGLAWHNFPFVAIAPEYKLDPDFRMHPRRWDEQSQGFVPLRNDSALYSIAQAIFLADELIYACDPDHQGAITFKTALDMAERKSPPPIKVLKLDSLSDSAIQHAIQHADAYSFPESLSESLRFGEVKRFLDYNFNLNSAAILGRTLRLAGIKHRDAHLSKFSLQLFLRCSRDESFQREGLPVEILLRHMSNWQGTGRYADGKTTRLGSAMSGMQILQNLITFGILEEIPAPKQRLRLSPVGLRLAELLHPNCFDPDLPFRIEAWGAAGIDASIGPMSSYLNRFFGRQKRFIGDDYNSELT